MDTVYLGHVYPQSPFQLFPGPSYCISSLTSCSRSIIIYCVPVVLVICMWGHTWLMKTLPAAILLNKSNSPKKAPAAAWKLWSIQCFAGFFGLFPSLIFISLWLLYLLILLHPAEWLPLPPGSDHLSSACVFSLVCHSSDPAVPLLLVRWDSPWGAAQKVTKQPDVL